MALPDFTGETAKMRSALETLEVAWDATENHWNDKARKQFEENHIRPLVPQVKASLDAANRLADVLRQAVRACES